MGHKQHTWRALAGLDGVVGVDGIVGHGVRRLGPPRVTQGVDGAHDLVHRRGNAVLTLHVMQRLFTAIFARRMKE